VATELWSSDLWYLVCLVCTGLCPTRCWIFLIVGWASREDGSIAIWKMVPHWLVWCLWRERNAWHFEDIEQTISDLKLLFFNTLFEWVLGLGIHSIHSLVELIDLCKFDSFYP
jgi:hypothetical protein